MTFDDFVMRMAEDDLRGRMLHNWADFKPEWILNDVTLTPTEARAIVAAFADYGSAVAFAAAQKQLLSALKSSVK